MDSEKRDFILSDGTQTNSKGFKVKVAGGRFERFDSNPIMLYNHDTEQVIGRWEQRRIEDNKLLATPVFDTSDPKAAEIARKVTDGFLRGASIGITALNMEKVGDDYILTEWELIEASITPIPSDAGAIRLYNEKREIISFEQLHLSMKDNNIQKPSKDTYRNGYKQICCALGLNPFDEIDIVLGCIHNLMKPKSQEVIEKALNLGVIRDNEKDFFIKLARGNSAETIEMLNARIKDFEDKERKSLGKLYRDNMDKIVLHFGVEGWEDVKKLGYKSVEKIINQMPKRLTLGEMIKGQRSNNSSEVHNLDWYRKNDPKALQDDPELFETLKREKKLNK